MRYIFFSIILSISFYNISQARLGETEKEIIKRYGNPINIIKKNHKNTYKFLISDTHIEITIKSNQKFASEITYTSKDKNSYIHNDILVKILKIYDINVGLPFDGKNLYEGSSYKGSCRNVNNTICKYYNAKNEYTSCTHRLGSVKSELRGRSTATGGRRRQSTSNSRMINLTYYSNNGKIRATTSEFFKFFAINLKKVKFSKSNLGYKIKKLKKLTKSCRGKVKELNSKISKRAKKF